MDISDRELRERLLSFGYNAPPVTDNSRGLLLKKLKKFESENNHLASQEDSNPRKSKSVIRNQDSSPEKRDTSHNFNSDAVRSARVSRKEIDNVDLSSKKKKNSPSLDKYNKTDPFEKGSDSDESYSSGISSQPSLLARKPLNMRRDTEFFSMPVYKKFDTDNNGVSSYLNRNMEQSHYPRLNKSSVWTKVYNQLTLNKLLTPSIVLLVFVLFFLLVGGIYYSKNDRIVGELLTETAIRPKCSLRGREGISCIADKEMDDSLEALKILHRSLYKAQVDATCNSDVSKSITMSKESVIELLVRELALLRYEADKMTDNMAVLVNANPQFRITWSNKGFSVENPELPWRCALKMWLSLFISYAYYMMITLLLVLSMHFLFRYGITQHHERTKGTQDLIKGILDILQQNAIANPSKNYLPIVHVRDQLISYADRERKKKMWADAVKYVEENESRIRKEVQLYQGEDYDVWRWIGSHQQSPPKPKTWQGEAFETSKDNINTPSTSPTPCLKIRHMFDPKNETTDGDWVTVVKDAILERCEGISIVHISVDEASPDGCVYIKCASTDDAGKAYRRIHGAWFDGEIVSVKYLRLERYHERFPNSVNFTTPLVPSNDQKRSIV